jgi:trans-aconitate methyltransferase
MFFRNPEESHAHSLETLNWLYEHDDFMMSVSTFIDLGCGTGLDLEWWATRTTRDEIPQPLNIKCTGLDLIDTPSVARKYANITYQQNNFETQIHTSRKSKYDVLWSHDSFQYAIDPLATLKLWHTVAEPGAMLVLIVPQTTNIEYRKLSFIQPSGCYYHYTLVNLIHMLAITGWDCNSGFFKKSANDPWLHAVVYRSDVAPMDPKISWYQLAETGLLPESAVASINKHGFVNQNDLVLPWLDKSLTWYGQQ